MKYQTKLKGLQSQASKLEAEIDNIKLELFARQKELNLKNQTLQSIKKEIERFTSGEIVVSEHAILRYFERVLNFNIEEIKSKILTPEVQSLYDSLGGGEFPVENKFTVVLKDNTVITIK